ncbi:MAG: putative metal-binding motif-containing protein [Myxococcota bacterium]
MHRRLAPCFALLFSACSVEDVDEDGFAAPEDCDDLDPEHNPNTPERCDGQDNNCNGIADESVTLTVFTDADGDGFGDPATEAQVCVPADGQVDNRGDCDDTRRLVHPSAPERCNGLDDDCVPETPDPWGAYFEGRDGKTLLITRNDDPNAHHDLSIDTDGTLLFCRGTYQTSVAINGAQVIVGSTGPCSTALYVLETRQPVGPGAKWIAIQTRTLDVHGAAAWRTSPRLGVPVSPTWAYAVGLQSSCTSGGIEWGRANGSDPPPAFGALDGWVMGPREEVGRYTTYERDGQAWLMRLGITSL